MRFRSITGAGQTVAEPDARCVCVLPKRKKQKARPKGVNLKVRWRAKVAMREGREDFFFMKHVKKVG